MPRLSRPRLSRPRLSRPRLSYANVVATLALVLAASGGAYAATQLPKNSVGSKQVKNSSLQAKDFKPGQLPAGATGPAGPQGSPGTKGDQGAPGDAGPNLLQAGRKDFNTQSWVNQCASAELKTDGFTVSRPGVLWAEAAGEYLASGAAIGLSHNANLEVYLLGGIADDILATAHVGGMRETDHALLTSQGWVATNVPYVLQPGTTYKLAIAFGLSGAGACTGGATLFDPSLSWSILPAPQ
jgi:hypothetical protein